MQLPLIIGFGGINSAGRSSGNHAYGRLVFDALDQNNQGRIVQSLSGLVGAKDSQSMLNNTLVRELSDSWYQQHQTGTNRQVQLHGGSTQIRISTRQLPDSLPNNWRILGTEGQETIIAIDGEQAALIETPLTMATRAAACLPEGFDPGVHYQSKNHPRALQMALFALSDCLGNSGLEWEYIQSLLPPDQISVYAGSSFGQFDNYGIGGLLKSGALGKRATAKQVPLGYPQSPADFANAYVLGNLGATGATLGACASFLYNLRQASEDIRTNRCQLAVVGSSEAPLIPELMNGFSTMQALCSDHMLRQLDQVPIGSDLDFRRACRPFGNNAGFVMAESAQFFLLASPQFAAQIGACNFGSVAEVFVNADGYKKSISSTGAGNFITLAKASARLRAMLGDTALQHNSVVHAHGTGTPLNRVTESLILNTIAKAYSIPQWPVTSIKGQLGHSQGSAGADQLATTLGFWQHAIFPGIETTKDIAQDVHQSNLDILLQPKEIHAQAAFLNAKGFGGNNATGLILSPEIAERAMKNVLTREEFRDWQKQQEQTTERSAAYDQRATAGDFSVRYLFNHQVIHETDIYMDASTLQLPGHRAIHLDIDHGYGDIFDL